MKKINNYIQLNVNSGTVIYGSVDTGLTKLPLGVHGAFRTPGWI